jgi:beta-aspartyl-dipeptidase (metallo-type)
MLTLIENGDVCAPQLLGRQSVLLFNSKVAKIGAVDRRAVENLGVEFDVLDATDCLVTPGFIDPHEHLLGGSGEEGFASQTPEIALREIISAGITTVVGCLGVDTTMKTLQGLLAKVKAFREEGITAFMYTGGYNVPPTTLTNSLRNDLLFIEEVIGAGEIAISDERSTDPMPPELARLVNDAFVGGRLGNKAGITHFHVGDKKNRLNRLMTLMDTFDVNPGCLYPTHIERSEALMKDAILLSNHGAFVDMDTVNEDLGKWLKFYLEHDGNIDRLTVSSDASITSPGNLYNQIRACVVEHRFSIQQVLPLVTLNTAAVLALSNKGRLAEGKDADILIIRKDGFELRDVIARGKVLVKQGELQIKEKFLQDSNRRISLNGAKQ